MHLTACPRAKPFWDRVLTFSRTVLGCPDPPYRQQPNILNRWSRDKLWSEEARALIRHAVGHFYRDFSMVDTRIRVVL